MIQKLTRLWAFALQIEYFNGEVSIMVFLAVRDAEININGYGGDL